MSKCHKMKLEAEYDDGSQLWICSQGCNWSWHVQPQEIGPPKLIKRIGTPSGDVCHSYGYQIKPDDLVLSMGISDD